MKNDILKLFGIETKIGGKVKLEFRNLRLSVLIRKNVYIIYILKSKLHYKQIIKYLNLYSQRKIKSNLILQYFLPNFLF